MLNNNKKMTLQGVLVLKGLTQILVSIRLALVCLSVCFCSFCSLSTTHTHTYMKNIHTHTHTYSSPNLYVACNLFIVLSLIFFLSVLIYFNYLYYFVCAVCIFFFRLSAWKSIICSRVLIVLWTYLCLTSFYIF